MAEIPAEFAAALSDRYRLRRELGRGGMASVFLAEDLKHHRRVAVKVLRGEIADVLGPERFLREIEVVGRLRHPHILPLYDSGRAGGFLYYVMPLVEGESLRDRLDREKQLPLDEALGIVGEVADALAYAHRRGVVHRDIKPENILLESGHAVVADFGIARAIGAAAGERLTETGIALGTPQYMSPEQAAGDREIDGRSDLYGLGCVLYEMLAGEPPFTGPTVQSVLHQHLAAEPRPVTQLRPAVPPAIAAALSRALAKTSADRWKTAEEFQAQLRAPARSSAAPRPARSRWLLSAGTAAAILALALIALRATRRAAPDVTVGRRVQVTFAPGLEVHPALSPRGDLVAYTAGWTSQLFVKEVQGGDAIPVARELRGIQGWPHWAPDGTQLSFASARGVEIVPALGGTPHLLVSMPSTDSGGPTMVIGGPWSPDGREVSFVHGDTVYAVPAAGGTPRVVVAEPGLHSCAWSPNGRWLACVKGNAEAVMLGPVFGNLARSGLVLVPAAGGPVERLLDDGSASGSPAWLPDGTLLFVSDREGGRDVYAVRLDGKGRAQAPPRRITTGLNALTITVSADGARLAYDAFAETSNIWSVAVPSGRAASIAEARQVSVGDQVIEHFDISRDGRWLVFDASRGGVSRLYRVPLDRLSDVEQLTRDSVDEFEPAWSPDRRQIAFHSFGPDGRRQVHVIPAEGGPGAELRSGTDDRDPVWTPDGQGLWTLTDYGRADAGTRIRRRGPDGTWSASTPWRTPPCAPAASPDGRRVACAEHTGRVLLTDLAGDPQRVLVERGSLRDIDVPPGWSSDGRTVYYVGADSAGIAIFAVAAQGGRPRLVLRLDDPTRPWHRYGFQVSRDRLYFTAGDRQSHLWLAELGRRGASR